MYKIIDIKQHNVLRLYLANEDCNDYWGDDWNDTPFEHNAGPVYDKYIDATLDIYLPYDVVIAYPENDYCYYGNTPFSKEMFKEGLPRCFIYNRHNDWEMDYSYFTIENMLNEDEIHEPEVVAIYFNQKIDREFMDKLHALGCINDAIKLKQKIAY